MASQSTRGKPRRAAVYTGMQELMPPASIGITAKAFLPKYDSTAWKAACGSFPLGSFSSITEGAPIMAEGITRASSGTWSGSRSVTSPLSRTASLAMRRPR